MKIKTTDGSYLKDEVPRRIDQPVSKVGNEENASSFPRPAGGYFVSQLWKLQKRQKINTSNYEYMSYLDYILRCLGVQNYGEQKCLQTVE